ncbi:Retinol dehydrogenase 14 [Cladophialophora carrionii]|uniref:Retinol dehydrogenase 14 n=1 Tax=Cladophialophora carrionii TaxID=86049 RepID=A0A1C1CTC2_9EURO|nr:Retinol dehydrogenase 14 [Cladophialophora carrionii]
MTKFDPAKDIPNLEGKVCLVTGGNSGLGEATVAALAQHGPRTIYLAARSRAKAEAALSRVRATSAAASSANIQILDLDLASFESIRAAAARVHSEVDRLDVLHLNAGVAMIPHSTTEEGYEVQFGTNYLGHALLTQLLMPLLVRTTRLSGADVRIVSMSSVGHKFFASKTGIFFDELKTEMKTHSGAELYGAANLAKTLFAYELAKRYPRITTSSLHPGTVKSNVWGGEKGVNVLINYLVVKPLVALTGVSNEEGAKTQLWRTFSNEVESGRYYEPIGKAGKDGPLSRDDELSRKLWEWTDRELQEHGAPGWPSPD